MKFRISSDNVSLHAWLTVPVTASCPTETIRLFRIHHRAAMRWNGWLGQELVGASRKNLTHYSSCLSVVPSRPHREP